MNAEEFRKSRQGTEEERLGNFFVDSTSGSDVTGDATRRRPVRTWAFLVSIGIFEVDPNTYPSRPE